MNILLVDDHAIIRFGVRLLLKTEFPRAAIFESESFDAAVKLLSTQPVDLVILDINIPGGNNLRMIDVVRLKQPRVKILLFTAYDEQLFASRYLQAGANGYLIKDSPEEEIVKAIKTVLNDELYISESIKQEFLNKFIGRKNTPADVFQQLSNRETEIMQLLLKGCSPTEICQLLNLRASTISTYKARIYEKLEVKNIVELIEKYNVLT